MKSATVEVAIEPGAKLCYTVPEAARAMGLPLTAMWSLVGTGEVRSIKIGRRRVISDDSLRQFITAKQGEA